MASNALVTFPHIPVGEYLGSVYRPDVDYVDGELEKRNVGEFDHAVLQRVLLFALASFEGSANVYALQEIRVQTQATRFRIPDVCLLVKNRLPKRIVTEPPLLCVEVLSPRDTVERMRVRCLDYLHMGVPEVWIFDPDLQAAYVLRSEGMKEFRAGFLELPHLGIRLNVEEIFRDARRLSEPF